MFRKSEHSRSGRSGLGVFFRLARKEMCKIMLSAFVFCWCFIASALASGQEESRAGTEPSKAVPGTLARLDEVWMGTWKGEAKSISSRGDSANFGMTIEIKRLENPIRYQWKTVFTGAQGDVVKAYELIPQPKENHFVIDEKNGILIDTILFDDTLISHFTVQDQTIWCQYRVVNEPEGRSIEFDLYAATSSAAKSSGGKDGIPEVKSLVPTTRQTAKLIQQK